MISTGGADFSGIGDFFANAMLQKQKLAQEDQRFQLLKNRVEQEMEQARQEEERRKAAEQRTQSLFQQGQAARKDIAAGITEATQGPIGPPSEDQQFEYAIRAQTERAGKLAARMAQIDPEKGVEFAQRLLNEERQGLQRLTADRGLTQFSKDIGEGLTSQAYGPAQFGDQPVEDPTYQEAMKGVLQEIQTASGPDVPVEEKVRALQKANETRRQVRKELTARNEKNAAVAAAKQTIGERAAESAARLTTIQKARLGALASNVGFEEGMVPPDKVDAEAERIIRGTVQVPNPFSFGGGDMLEMTPESALTLQKGLAEIERLRAQKESEAAQGQYYRSGAALRERTNPNIRGSSGEPGRLLNLARATQIAKDEIPELEQLSDPGAVRRRAQELMRQSGGTNGQASGASTLIQEIKAGRFKSVAELKARAAELGVSYAEARAAMGAR